MTGEVELRMVARPASTERSAHAIKVKGITLFNRACTAKRRHTAGSLGIGMRCAIIQSRRSDPAINVLAAMSVNGGMVATPTLMNV